MTHDFLTTSPLKLDDATIKWLGAAIRRQLQFEVKCGWPVKDGDLIDVTAVQFEKAMVETRNRVAAAHAAGKRLGSGTWTGNGSVLELVDATNALAEVLP